MSILCFVPASHKSYFWKMWKERGIMNTSNRCLLYIRCRCIDIIVLWKCLRILYFFSKYFVTFAILCSNMFHSQIYFSQTNKFMCKMSFELCLNQTSIRRIAWRKICFSYFLKITCLAYLYISSGLKFRFHASSKHLKYKVIKVIYVINNVKVKVIKLFYV